MKNLFKLFSIIIFIITSNSYSFAAEKAEYLKTDWSFKGLFGKFDRASLQRGYQVYTEVCASCHSMKYLSYRNLAEPGGPEFSESQAKAIAASFEVTDGPNSDGEMFTRPGKLSDKFVMPYDNVKQLKLQMEVRILLICLFWLKQEEVVLTIFILYCKDMKKLLATYL